MSIEEDKNHTVFTGFLELPTLLYTIFFSEGPALSDADRDAVDLRHFFCSPQVRRPEKNCPSEPVGRLTGGTEVFDSAKAGNGEKHVSIEAPFFGMAYLRSRRKKSIETDGDTRKNPPSALKEKYGAALIGCTVSRMIRRSFAACGKLRSEFLCCL